MVRIIYSILSSFFKIFFFILALLVGYEFNEIGTGVIEVWQRVPFICLAIFGTKEFIEFSDSFIRKKIGFSQD